MKIITWNNRYEGNGLMRNCMCCGVFYSSTWEMKSLQIYTFTYTRARVRTRTHTHTHTYLRERELWSWLFNNYFSHITFKVGVLFYLNFLFILNCYACTEESKHGSHYHILQGSLMNMQTFIGKLIHILMYLCRIEIPRKRSILYIM